MLTAIATDGNAVSAHFGRCSCYTLTDIEAGAVKNIEKVSNPGHEPGAIPRFLHEMGAKRIVCGGMGARATELFSQFGIEIITGIGGPVDEVLSKLAQGTLVGGESLCQPGAGRGYGVEKTECDHAHE